MVSSGLGGRKIGPTRERSQRGRRVCVCLDVRAANDRSMGVSVGLVWVCVQPSQRRPSHEPTAFWNGHASARQPSPVIAVARRRRRSQSAAGRPSAAGATPASPPGSPAAPRAALLPSASPPCLRDGHESRVRRGGDAEERSGVAARRRVARTEARRVHEDLEAGPEHESDDDRLRPRARDVARREHRGRARGARKCGQGDDGKPPALRRTTARAMAAKDKDSKKPPVWKQTLGGGLAGAIEVTIMYPTGASPQGAPRRIRTCRRLPTATRRDAPCRAPPTRPPPGCPQNT